MLKRKYLALEKPIFYPKEMSFWEQWRDIQFHKRLWKVDEKMLFLQAKMDGEEEGIAKTQLKIARTALAEGATPEFVQRITGLDSDAIRELR